MPYANNQGVRIYYEVEGEGPALVLAHALTSNLDSWRRFGYVEALKGDYQIVLFDARGHGRSDKPHEPMAYGFNLADDVVAVLDDLGITQAHYFGYSMGALIGFGLAIRYPERFRSFILGGASPYPTVESARLLADVFKVVRMLQTDPDGALAAYEDLAGGQVPADLRDSLLANDARSLSALMTSQDITRITKSDLSRIAVPCLLYCGELDPNYSSVREAANDIPRAKFVSLPGLDHVPAMASRRVVLPYVKKFLVEVAKD